MTKGTRTIVWSKEAPAVWSKGIRMIRSKSKQWTASTRIEEDCSKDELLKSFFRLITNNFTDYKRISF